MPKYFSYGGQAIIEGVMIRGRSCSTLAVRLPNGRIHSEASSLPNISSERLRQVPFLRGILVLAETLLLGVRALTRSANLALDEELEGKELNPWIMKAMLAIPLIFGISFFFVLPLLAARFFEGFFPNSSLMNVAEGILRLGLLIGYIWLVGRMQDIKSVFAYHGAEHMAVHAYEHGTPLTPQHLRHYPTMHPRCGTAFLLVVMIVSLLLFTLLGKPPLWISVLSRIGLVPVIAAMSYEVIRWSGRHATHPLVHFLITPSLALQKLTTRDPDDKQLEVAIVAMTKALEQDGAFPAPSMPSTNGETSFTPHEIESPNG